MSSDLLIEFAVSLVGVAFLVGVSWLLGGMKSVKVTGEAAADRLSFDEPDFRIGEWFVAADERAAAAISADGGETAFGGTIELKDGRAKLGPFEVGPSPRVY